KGGEPCAGTPAADAVHADRIGGSWAGRRSLIWVKGVPEARDASDCGSVRARDVVELGVARIVFLRLENPAVRGDHLEKCETDVCELALLRRAVDVVVEQPPAVRLVVQQRIVALEALKVGEPRMVATTLDVAHRSACLAVRVLRQTELWSAARRGERVGRVAVVRREVQEAARGERPADLLQRVEPFLV